LHAYARVSAAGPAVRRLSGELKGLDQLLAWIDSRVVHPRIFSEWDRFMMADQVIVYRAGGPVDVALLLGGILTNWGRRPWVVVDCGRDLRAWVTWAEGGDEHWRTVFVNDLIHVDDIGPVTGPIFGVEGTIDPILRPLSSAVRPLPPTVARLRPEIPT